MSYYVWSFSFRLYCFDTEARLTFQCCNKYLHYWQPANLTHNTGWMRGLHPEWVPYWSWMHTLQWPPNLGLSFRRFCTMHMVNLFDRFWRQLCKAGRKCYDWPPWYWVRLWFSDALPRWRLRHQWRHTDNYYQRSGGSGWNWTEGSNERGGHWASSSIVQLCIGGKCTVTWYHGFLLLFYLSFCWELTHH